MLSEAAGGWYYARNLSAEQYQSTERMAAN